MALAQTVLGTDQKTTGGGGDSPSPTSNRVKGVPTTKSFFTHMVDVIDYSAEYRVDAPAVCRTIAGQK